MRNHPQSVPRHRIYLDLLKLFLKLGFTGFGGPLVHIAMMEDEVVEKRKWLAKEQFMEGLAVCQLLPGPASTQLGIYIGYVRGGFLGSIVAGAGFILPAFLIIVGLSWLYFRYETFPQVEGFFFGVNPAVIALIGWSCYRMSKSAITDWKLAIVFVASFLATWLVRFDVLLLLVIAGGIGILVYAPFHKRVKLPAVLWFAGAGGSLHPFIESHYVALLLFFLKVGAFIYGGGLVIIPFIEQEVVNKLGWMTSSQFLDGVALGQITPGPVVITAAFVGYKVASFLGAAVAAFAIFFPSFIFILVAGKSLDRVRNMPTAKAFLKGVNAAVVGAILGASVGLGKTALFHGWALESALTTAIAVLCFWLILKFKVDTVYLIVGSGISGLILRQVL